MLKHAVFSTTADTYFTVSTRCSGNGLKLYAVYLTAFIVLSLYGTGTPSHSFGSKRSGCCFRLQKGVGDTAASLRFRGQVDMPRWELSVGRAFAYQDHTMVSDVINGVENRRSINYVRVAESEENGKLLRSEKLFGFTTLGIGKHHSSDAVYTRLCSLQLKHSAIPRPQPWEFAPVAWPLASVVRNSHSVHCRRQ